MNERVTALWILFRVLLLVDGLALIDPHNLSHLPILVLLNDLDPRRRQRLILKHEIPLHRRDLPLLILHPKLHHHLIRPWGVLGHRNTDIGSVVLGLGQICDKGKGLGFVDVVQKAGF